METEQSGFPAEKQYTTLIGAEELQASFEDTHGVVIDCRFSLNDTEQGRRAYQEAHIPGAVYAHLDEDLSGPIHPGKTGRHPLPDPAVFARTLSAWGVTDGVQVVVYDDMGGGIAARLWWMLRWMGHDAVAVLDGGWPQWVAAGKATRYGVERPTARMFTPRIRSEWVVSADTIDRMGQDPQVCLLDARATERYQGTVEPLDPVAGHIPGALSAPFKDNLDADECFLSADQLRARFEGLLGIVAPAHAICYCGSGVTAAHNLLAMAHAGLPGARLYAGSWSHWITNPDRSIARTA